MKKIGVLIAFLILFSITALAAEETPEAIIQEAVAEAQANLTGEALPPAFQKIISGKETILIRIPDAALNYAIVVNNGVINSIGEPETLGIGIIISIPKDTAAQIITSEDGGKLFFQELDKGTITVEYNVPFFKKLKYKSLVFIAKTFV